MFYAKGCFRDMIAYVCRRLLSLVFVLFVVSALVFVLMNLVPGGPFTLADRGYSGAALENLERKYGLDKPIHIRYVNYLVSVLQLDFGNSYSVAGNPPITELIARIWPVTFQLGLYTILLSFGLGVFLGIVAAYYHNSIIDNLVTLVAMVGIAVPNFVIATWFLLIFGFQNGWGEESQWIIGPIVPGGAAILSWDYFLPVITYALAPLALVSRYTRACFADALQADFIRTARSKGLSERFIMLRHVLRNALIPMITVLLPQIPNLLTGSLFIEVIYGVPGLGKFFVTSIFNRDYPMIMGLVLLIAVLWGLTYLITDLLYTVIDPRIRLGERKGA